VITFKTFFEQKSLGLIETINIEGIGPIDAKVDSGNGAYNVLHGVNVSVNNKEVIFTTIDGKKISKPFKGYIDINIGSGNIEQRPTIEFNVSIHGEKHKNIRFSIADRTQNEEKVLLGKDFIAALGGLIDVNK